MTTIEAFNYRVSIDARGTQSGAAITRRELSTVRSTFRSLTDPADQASHRIDLLTRAMNQGAIEFSDYAAAVAKLRSTLPEAIADQKRLADAQSQAATVRRSLMSDEERYREEVRRMAALVKANALSHDEARRSLAAYRDAMPAAVAAVRAKNEAERSAAAIQRSLMTDEQRYAAELQRVTLLVRQSALDRNAAREHLARYRAQMPSVIAAEREHADALARAAQIVRQNETAIERYQRRLRELNQLHRAGAIDTRNHAREVVRLRREQQQSATTGTGTGTGAAAAALLRMTPAAMGTTAALYTTVGAMRSILRESFAMETARANFDVFTGSVENGKRLFEDLINISSGSPLSFEHYGNGAKQLLGYGAAAKSILPTLDMLDDISTGDPQKFASLARVFGQVTAAGKLTGEDLLQFIDAGFNPLQQLAKTREEYAKLREQMSDGQFSVEMVTQAMEKATSEGGRFYGMIESRGATAAGATARLASEFQLLKADIGSIAHTPIAWLSSTGAGIVGTMRTGIAKFSPQVQEIATTLNGMTGDLHEIGEGLLRLDWDRVQSGFNGDKAYENWKRFKDLQAEIAEGEPEPPKSTGYTLPFDLDALAARQREIDRDTAAEVETLKQRNLALSMGAEWAESYKQSVEGVSASVREELAALKERNKELELADQITQKTAAIERQARLANEAERIRSAGIDTDTAAQMAELREMGAGTDALQRHLQARRELLAIQQRQRAEQQQTQRLEQMAGAAQSIRDGQRSPAEALAAEFVRLREMRAADLLSDREYHIARTEAARKAAAAKQETAPTRGAAFGSLDEYRALVEQQTERRRKMAEDRRTAEMLANADKIAGADRRRLTIQQQTTREMTNQNRLLEQGASRGASATQPAAADNSELIGLSVRIAEAAERAADRLERLEAVGAV